MLINYADIIDNDIVNGEGICVSVWIAGCKHKCKGCHNRELWAWNRNHIVNKYDFFNKLDKLISANGMTRNLSILGGEPLDDDNIYSTTAICEWYKRKYPNNKIFLWTGYTLEELHENKMLTSGSPLDYVDVLIDGRYEESKRDIRLKLRGSANQRILYKGKDF